MEVPDKEEHVPMAFVVKKPEYDINADELIRRVLEECRHLLKENEIPKHIVLEDSLKYTDNNKYDFRYYEKLGKAFILLKNKEDNKENVKKEVLVICRENLPEYMVPEEISFVEEMPRTPRGKIDYRALEELD